MASIDEKRQRRQRSKSSSSLPLDLASEILLKLPEKSVVRFRCVSKPWSSITTDPYFINLFKARSPRLLLCFQANYKLFVSSIPQHHQTFETSNKSYFSSKPIDRYDMDFPINDFFHPTESVQGLICFRGSTKQIVWNPSTRQLLTLPELNMSWKDLTIFLGYDPVESKHKVICIPFSGSSDECKVLTLGSAQESWRTVKTNLLNNCFAFHLSGKCIKGVVYYLSYVRHTDGCVLMSFDVRYEKFDTIQLPPSDDVHHYVLMAYQGRLACAETKLNMKNRIRLWILDDAEKHKWSSKDFVVAPLNTLDQITSCYFQLIDFTHTGEIIYVVHKFKKPYCVLFCDPVRNSFRRFELEGIIDDKFVFSNLNRYRLYIFPSHVESGVSL